MKTVVAQRAQAGKGARARLAFIVAAGVLATMLVGGATSAASTGFRDVPRDYQFYDEIMWLADMGVTTGYADGTFRPNEPVTREAFAAFLYRMAGSPDFLWNPNQFHFDDVRPGETFHTEITWVGWSGISRGWDDGAFRLYRPKEPISREAIAAFLYRLAGEPTFTPPARSPFTDVRQGAAFYKEITWLASTGLSRGWSDGTFRPKDSVSRAAIAAFLYRGSAGLRGTGEGFYTVGEQLFPGTYIAEAHGSNFCEWEAWDETGERVIAWSSTPVRGIATLTAGVAFFIPWTCGTWRPLRATSPHATSFGDGTFVAGYHMRPGTYEAPGGARCYRAGYLGFTGRDELFDVGWGDEATPRIRVETGQGIAAIGCGTWTRISD